MNLLSGSFKEEKLEELLVANWTQFIDSSKLLAFVLQNVQQNKSKLAMIPNSEINPKGIKITLSRCYLTTKGFFLWVEFTVPLAAKQVAEGTMELLLHHNGSINYLSNTGNIVSA